MRWGFAPLLFLISVLLGQRQGPGYVHGTICYIVPHANRVPNETANPKLLLWETDVYAPPSMFLWTARPLQGDSGGLLYQHVFLNWATSSSHCGTALKDSKCLWESCCGFSASRFHHCLTRRAQWCCIAWLLPHLQLDNSMERWAGTPPPPPPSRCLFLEAAPLAGSWPTPRLQWHHCLSGLEIKWPTEKHRKL